MKENKIKTKVMKEKEFITQDDTLIKKAKKSVRNTVLLFCFQHMVSNEFTIHDLAQAWQKYSEQHNMIEPGNMPSLTVSLLLRGFMERMESEGKVEVKYDEFHRASYIKLVDYDRILR